jgi:pilus assembly protein CpaF
LVPVNIQPILTLLETPGVTDVLVNGTLSCFVDCGGGLKPVEKPFADAAQLAETARWMIAQADRHLDFANPIADCVLSAGELGLTGSARFRVHAVLASASSPNTLISIRRHEPAHLGVESFAGDRLELSIWLQQMVERRENFLISGATGAGKTTLLGSLMSLARGQRVIAVEEVSEITCGNGHFISLQCRQANTEGKGEISLDRLVREALRMRPDRLLMGEIRGPELLTFLSALNTGHRGAGGTIHANNAAAVANRLVTIGLQSGWSGRAVAASAAEAIDWVIHVERQGSERLITEVSKLALSRRGALELVPCAELHGLL